MSRRTHGGEGWALEIVLCLLIGLPWYGFARSIPLAGAVHVILIVAYLSLELLVFGRGSAIASFLLILVLSVLAGLIAVGINAGRLGT